MLTSTSEKMVDLLTVKRFEAKAALENAPVKFERLGAGEPLPDWLSTEPEAAKWGRCAILWAANVRQSAVKCGHWCAAVVVAVL